VGFISQSVLTVAERIDWCSYSPNIAAIHKVVVKKKIDLKKRGNLTTSAIHLKRNK